MLVKQMELESLTIGSEFNKSQAEIHIQTLAEAMWDEYNQSKPKQLESGQWHIPFGDNMNEHDMFHALNLGDVKKWGIDSFRKELNKAKIKIATARAARLSYMTFDGEIDYKKILLFMINFQPHII